MRVLFTAAVLTAASTAHASATPVGEFVGDVFESWESHPGGFPSCYDIDSGTVCSDTGGIHGTGGWGYICGVSPTDGSRLMGNNGTTSTYTFDTPIQSFGGMWSTNSGDGTVATLEFYNAAGALVGMEEVSLTVCGVWYWGGWEFSEGVTEVVVTKPGTHLMSDEFTYSFGDGVGGGTGLEVGGSCPGPVDINITGTERGRFMIAVADMMGSTIIPSGPCAGTDIGIQNASGGPSVFGPFSDGDGDGMVNLSPSLPPSVCRRMMVAIDLATCDVSSPVGL